MMLGQIEVAVIQKNRLMNKIFNGALTCMIIFNTINMGSALDLRVVKATFMKPIGPAVGAFCQFVAMPLVSHVIYTILILLTIGSHSYLMALAMLSSLIHCSGWVCLFWVVLREETTPISGVSCWEVT